MGSTEKSVEITYNKKLIWPFRFFLVVLLVKLNNAKVTAFGKHPSIYTIFDTSKYALEDDINSIELHKFIFLWISPSWKYSIPSWK